MVNYTIDIRDYIYDYIEVKKNVIFTAQSVCHSDYLLHKKPRVIQLDWWFAKYNILA